MPRLPVLAGLLLGLLGLAGTLAAGRAVESGRVTATLVTAAPAPSGVRTDTAARVARFVTNPVVAAVLVAGGFLLVLADVLTVGFGVPGLL
ncbi:hypothetical protein, partial [Deinococcus pimensis]|uniref:hypothetical protein n=1 Tax=Deinococcus pimensis TaxID=309888 RepID=UPI0006935ACC